MKTVEELFLWRSTLGQFCFRPSSLSLNSIHFPMFAINLATATLKFTIKTKAELWSHGTNLERQHYGVTKHMDGKLESDAIKVL
eukprot:c6681_g1_i1 orf=370-621(+)